MNPAFFQNFPAAPRFSGKVYDFHSDEEITEGVFTAANSGTNTVLDSANHGWMRIASNGAADDSGGEWQADSESITLSPRKTVKFMSRHNVNLVEQSDFRAGIAELDTSWITAVDNGIFFASDDGDSYLDAIVRVGGATVASALQVATLANATIFELGIDVVMTGEADGEACFYVNGDLVARLPVVMPSTTLLTVGVAGISGAAASTTFDTDYVAWLNER